MNKLIAFSASIWFAITDLGAQNVGPWVTNVSGNSASILWMTPEPGTGWVETGDGERHYQLFAGRRSFGTLHRVDLKIDGLDSTIIYRVGGEPLSDASDPRKPVFAEGWAGKWHEVKLFSRDSSVSFSMLNDIHSQTERYKALVSGIDPDSTDFIFLAGDIAQTGNYELEGLVSKEIEPLGELAAILPVMFARGNHEGRGTGIRNVAAIFPNNVSEAFYYTFRQGPAAFVVLDGGETGEGRALRFSGHPVYEEYLEEQLEWASKALFEKEFAEAPLKVCLIHVPMIDHPDKSDYILQRWLNRKFVPLLNRAGIDIMLGADLHEEMQCLPGTMGNDFPIIVNDDLRRLDFKASDHVIRINCYDPDGKETFSASFKY